MTSATPSGTELATLIEVTRRFVERHHPVADARRLLETQGPYDAIAWDRLHREIGLTGVATGDLGDLPRLGTLTTLQEIFGANLAASPWFATTVLAGTFLHAAAGAAATQEHLDGRTAALLGPTTPLLEVPGALPLAAQHDGAAVLLTGGTTVVDGASAALWVAVARCDDGSTVVATVRPGAPGSTVRSLDPIDATRPIAEVSMDRTIASRWWPVDGARLADVIAEVSVLLAAEMVGAAQRCLDSTVAYARDRMAFGQPIGSFQAIQHHLADLFVDVSRSRALLAEAVREREGAAFRGIAHMACAQASETLTTAAERQIAIHGGIGFTWEHDAHLYLRRATSSQVVWGRPADHWEAAARELGLEVDEPGDDRT